MLVPAGSALASQSLGPLPSACPPPTTEPGATTTPSSQPQPSSPPSGRGCVQPKKTKKKAKGKARGGRSKIHHRQKSQGRRSRRGKGNLSRSGFPPSGVAPAPAVAAPPTAPLAPATTGNPDDATTIATWLGEPANSGAWPAGLSPDAFANAAATQTASLLATANQPPVYLIPIYKAAAERYHVPWQILAAINWIETDYGSNLNTSSAGAIGWMQFIPGTWQQYAITADGNGQPNPYNPSDAIFSAAHDLAANGAAQNLPKAIFAYNHAAWYVAEVIWRAQLITDHTGASNDTALAGSGQTGLPGAETMLVAAFSAVGGPYSQANHDSFGQSAADLRSAGTDCSGFVSWVLDRVDPSFGNQTTVTLPGQPGIQPGVGEYVTMWDRPLPGNDGHVIINILGTWFESGGNTTYNPAGGISPMSEAEAVGELMGGGFLPYHLKGL